MVYRGGLALTSTACYRFLTLGKEPEMPLSAKQRQQLVNVIASSEMEGGQVSEREKKNLEALMLGDLSIEDGPDPLGVDTLKPASGWRKGIVHLCPQRLTPSSSGVTLSHSTRTLLGRRITRSPRISVSTATP